MLGTGNKSFLVSTLTAGDASNPVQDHFTTLNGSLATSDTFSAPVLSADDLVFYYRITSTNVAVAGQYASTRASTAVDFPVGTLMPANIQDYWYVSGVSSDALTLFMVKDYKTFIFTRPDTTQPFVNPNGAAAPPNIAVYWDAKPLADCKNLVTTCSPGGCFNQQICIVDYP